MDGAGWRGGGAGRRGGGWGRVKRGWGRVHITCRDDTHIQCIDCHSLEEREGLRGTVCMKTDAVRWR